MFPLIVKEPEAVTTGDVLAFISARRTARVDAKVVRIEDGEAGPSARTIERRSATIAGLDSYLIVRGDVGVMTNPVPRGLAVRCPGARAVRGMPLIRTPRTLLGGLRSLRSPRASLRGVRLGEHRSFIAEGKKRVATSASSRSPRGSSAEGTLRWSRSPRCCRTTCSTSRS